MIKKFILISIISLFLIQCAADEPEKKYLKEARAERDQRMAWWREARFGMFIHWGIYSVPANEYKGNDQKSLAEWIMNLGPIPIPEYETYAAQFNPVKFDAEAWAKLAYESGVKYLVITSKHHDGFSLWDSKVSDYDIIDRTPFKRDVLKELSEACRKYGIKFCL